MRKVIRSGATEFRYEREEQPPPKIGRWRDTLDQLLLANEAKAARERLTLIRLFEELRGRGYDGGYDAVRRYARRWAKEHGAATASVYVPLSFAPGEAYTSRSTSYWSRVPRGSGSLRLQASQAPGPVPQTPSLGEWRELVRGQPFWPSDSTSPSTNMGEPPSNRRFAIRDADDDNCRCRSVVSAGLAAPMRPIWR